jgi:hypothetical protein
MIRRIISPDRLDRCPGWAIVTRASPFGGAGDGTSVANVERRMSLPIRMSHVPALASLVFVVAGCGFNEQLVLKPMIVIPNPIVTGQVQGSMVVVDNERLETRREIPRGSLTTKAVIDEVSAQQVCITVDMRQPNPSARAHAQFDLAKASAEITSDTGRAVAQIAPGPASLRTFQGVNIDKRLNPRCLSADMSDEYCRSREWVTITVPGTVEVIAQGARMCARNEGLITAQTKTLAIVIQVGPGKWYYAWAFR